MKDYQRGFEDALIMLDAYAKSRRELADRFRKRGSLLANGLEFNAEMVETTARIVRMEAYNAGKVLSPDPEDWES